MQGDREEKKVVATSAVKNALGERLRGSNATATVKLVAGMVSYFMPLLRVFLVVSVRELTWDI